MEGLQRSEISFRRQGSSGLVWDDKLLSGELKKIPAKEDENKAGAKASHGGGNAYKAVNVEPAAEPPSPRVSGCGVCGMFGKKSSAAKAKSKYQKRKPSAGQRKL